MKSVITIELLGPLEVRVGGSPRPLSYRRVEAALAYLVRESVVPKATLTELLWPGVESRKARANLRHVLYSLRQAGLSLSSSRGVVELDRSATVIDIEKIGTAPEIWRGDFCEGLYLDDSPEFEEWLLLQRETLRGRHLDGLMELARSHFARTDWEGTIRLASAASQLEPLELAPQRLIFQALANSGQQAALQKRLASFTETYLAEFGAPPPEEFLRPVAVLKGRSLPDACDSFMGRSSETENLLSLLKREKLITLTGPPGVGKSRLAAEALSRQERDAVLLDLTGTAAEEFEKVLLDPYLPQAL